MKKGNAKIHAYSKYKKVVGVKQVVGLIEDQMENMDETIAGTEIRQALKNGLDGNDTYLFCYYDKDENVIGFAYGNIGNGIESKGKYFWLNELFVEKDHRGKGVGTELLNFIEKWAKKKGIRSIVGVTGKRNERARIVYDKNGYEQSEIIMVGKKV